jgi:hypothetical protein
MFSFQSIDAQEDIDCSEFKTGKFFYTPPNGGEVTVKRTKKKQVERYNNENQKFIFEINWIDDCTYELTLVNARGLPKERKKEILGTSLYCKVTSASLGHYEISITSNGVGTGETLTIYSNR